MKIPEWIRNDFKGFDIDGNGTISQDEIDSLKGTDSIYDTSIFSVHADMDIETFIKENRTFYGSAVQYTDKEYTTGRKISQNDKLESTEETRKISNDDSKSVQVEQGEYAFKTYSEDTPSLQTYNICTCVAVTLYDKETKKGFLCHIDKIDRADSLEQIIKECGFNPQTTEARIIGGQTDYSEGVIETIDETLKKLNYNVVEYDVLGSGSRAIQLDLKTGEVSDYEEVNPTYKVALVKGTHQQPLIQNQQSE